MADNLMHLVIIRHGESEWNKANLFTGWTDVDLSEAGVQEALDGGKALKEAGYDFDICYTSYLKRAIHTLQELEAERASLRRASGHEQGRDRRQVR